VAAGLAADHRRSAAHWSATSLAELTPEDFAEVFAAGGAVEFVLLGVGLVNALPPRAVRDALKAAGVGLEFMSTEAAARTYNVLASEGRRLAAALIAVLGPHASICRLCAAPYT
jgi:uncharacterized protein